MSVDSSRPSTPDITAKSRRHIVIADPVAFRYLEDDASTQVVQRQAVLYGYELYLVEQWACSRESPTLVIVAYTGDVAQTVTAGVLSVPGQEREWSSRFRTYYKAIQQYHARPKVTSQGDLMVTNLSSFPSALTLISVPQGNITEHKQAFVINEDLKRMGCAGRSSMTLAEPTSATQARFRSLYKTHDRVAVGEAVLEVVRLCQVALCVFALLHEEYTDGLLCDKTEAAIGNWWTEIGSDYYDAEPMDGILGPTTVAALLGMLIGARNRLAACGAPISKDVFDSENTKKAISHFQKSQKIKVTRRLDRSTLSRLHDVTAKAAAGERWGVQKAVKSTVAEFGKKGEILSGIVGSKERAGIGEIETLNISEFRKLVYGESARWLWQGRPRRNTVDEHAGPSLGDVRNLLFGTKEDDSDHVTPERRAQTMPAEIGTPESRVKKRESAIHLRTASSSEALADTDYTSDREGTRKAVFRSVADRVNDARSGLGRIRDAVGSGIKGHIPRPSRDDNSAEPASPIISSLVQSSGSVSVQPGIGRAFTWKNKPLEYANGFRKDEMHNISEVTQLEEAPPVAVLTKTQEQVLLNVAAATGDDRTASRTVSSTASFVDVDDVQSSGKQGQDGGASAMMLMRRRNSTGSEATWLSPTSDGHRQRRMSFGIGEKAVLGSQHLLDDGDEVSDTIGGQALAKEKATHIHEGVMHLQNDITPRTREHILDLQALNSSLVTTHDELQAQYKQINEQHQRNKVQSREIMSEERARVSEAVRDVEVLVAKLDYEINALEYKVRDVEDEVVQFEASVEDVERRADELKIQLEMESWLHWAVRTVTGIGTGPNITRER